MGGVLASCTTGRDYAVSADGPIWLPTCLFNTMSTREQEHSIEACQCLGLSAISGTVIFGHFDLDKIHMVNWYNIYKS